METMITRHKFEIRRRHLTVSAVENLTPHMKRITLVGDELQGFQSPSFDDHVKLVFPTASGETVMREYTPRSYDESQIIIDFALHEAGPATAWAQDAKVGDSLMIGGPRGSSEITGEVDWWLLVADETALPAMGRHIEALGEGQKIISLAAVPSQEDRQTFNTKADLQDNWLIRPEAEAHLPEAMLQALQAIELPSQGQGFVWIAAESKVARALRNHIQSLGHPMHRMKAAGYWTKGMADTSDKALD